MARYVATSSWARTRPLAPCTGHCTAKDCASLTGWWCAISADETAEFWRVAPEIERGEIRPEDIKTEVFLFPAAAHVEKDGTFTNTQRLLQWHDKAVEPPGDCRSELRLYDSIWAGVLKRCTRRIESGAARFDVATLRGSRGAERGSRTHRRSMATPRRRQAVNDYMVERRWSTACGCWIFSRLLCDGVNQTARRKPALGAELGGTGVGLGVAEQSPILYNRASADPEASPGRSARSGLVGRVQQWTGHDVPDFVMHPPDYVPPPDARGDDAIAGDKPFILQGEGMRSAVRTCRIKGRPAPRTHEPEESVVHNPLYKQQSNPEPTEWKRRDNPYHKSPFDDAVSLRHHALSLDRASYRRRPCRAGRRGSPSCSRSCSARCHRIWRGRIICP